MQEKEIKLNIKIANRSYPITAKESELDNIKETESRLNQRIMKHQVKYKQEVQDALAMLLFLTESKQTQGQEDKTINRDQVRSINDQIESHLSQE